jgi:hypothetical protein
MDSSPPNWQANGHNKSLNPDQRGQLKMNEGQPPPPQMPQNQGQIGAAGLSAFSGSDLPAGWFMPFAGMEPPMSQNGNPPGNGGSRNDAGMDPFGSMFGSNGMMMPPVMDGLQHTL